MSGRNEQRKPGTTRGSPRRSRTAKASRISRHAVKSRCAHERDGWGRLSDDGPGHYNPDLSEGPWGGGVMILQGGAQSSLRPDTVRDNRCDYEAHEGRMQTGRRTAHAGSRLKPPIIGKAPLGKPAFQPYWGKPAVRNDRGDRGNVGIIRSPVRASILPDFHYLRTVERIGGDGGPSGGRYPPSDGCRRFNEFRFARIRASGVMALFWTIIALGAAIVCSYRIDRRTIYPVHVMTRKSFGLMTRKLSVTESQRSAQFPGTFSRKKLSVASANWAQVA